jgi:serine/threonine-protein kinase
MPTTTTAEAATTTTEATTTTTSLGPSPTVETVEVPLVGFVTEAEGVDALSAVGLAATVTYMASYTIEHGMVIMQHPLPGTIVAVGSTVELTVGECLELMTVPDVVGMDATDASLRISAEGLTPVETYAVTLNSDDWGIVIAQDPVGGTSLVYLGPVTMTIGKAPQLQVTIPTIPIPPSLPGP